MKLLSYRFFMALAVCLGAVHKSLGATQLTRDPEEMVVNSRDSYGMPTSITIGYSSKDFGQAESFSSTEKAFITWNITDGNEFYMDNGSPPGTLTVDSASQFTIDLDRSDLLPEVADYTIELTAVLSYNNRGTEVMMDKSVYKFLVNVAGLASSATISTTSGVTLEPTDPSVSYGEDIVLRATIDKNDLNIHRSLRGLNMFDHGEEEEETTQQLDTIWVDDMEPVIASSTDPNIIGFDYVWPNDAVSTTSSFTSETGTTTTTVEIVLKNVPDSVYNLGSIYVQLPVHYRKNNNDSNGEAGTLQLVAKVEFASADRSSSSGAVAASFTTIATAAAMASALLLSFC